MSRLCGSVGVKSEVYDITCLFNSFHSGQDMAAVTENTGEFFSAEWYFFFFQKRIGPLST